MYYTDENYTDLSKDEQIEALWVQVEYLQNRVMTAEQQRDDCEAAARYLQNQKFYSQSANGEW